MSYIHQFTRNKRQKDGKSSTKVIVRRLPPNFTSDIFKEHISPIPQYNYFYFVKADKVDRAHSFARAYINFIHQEDVFVFKEKYDNYVFLGQSGMEYPAVVEFAPFQKIPKERFFQKRDKKSGTIKNNDKYIQFVNNLKLSKYENIARPEYDLQLNKRYNERECFTPLLKYIVAKKSEQIKSRGIMEYRSEERKMEMKYQRSDNCMIFVNSSVKKTGIDRVYLKK